jgi:hypothetical protein
MSAPLQNKPPWRTETKPPWRTETKPPWRTETKPPWRSKTKPPWRTGTKRPWRTETASLYAWGRYADLDDYAQGFASDIINTLTRIHRMRVPITQETVRLFWDNHVFDHWNTALYARLLALLPGSLLTLPRYRSPGSTDGLGMIPSRQESEIGVVIGLAGSMAGLPDAVGDRVFLKPMPDFETESLRFIHCDDKGRIIPRDRITFAAIYDIDICKLEAMQMWDEAESTRVRTYNMRLAVFLVRVRLLRYVRDTLGRSAASLWGIDSSEFHGKFVELRLCKDLLDKQEGLIAKARAFRQFDTRYLEF